MSTELTSEASTTTEPSAGRATRTLPGLMRYFLKLGSSGSAGPSRSSGTCNATSSNSGTGSPRPTREQDSRHYGAWCPDRRRGVPTAQVGKPAQLNNDGLSGFSANDWLAPTVSRVVLGIYGAARPRTDSQRYQRARAAATVIAFAVDVLTI